MDRAPEEVLKLGISPPKNLLFGRAPLHLPTSTVAFTLDIIFPSSLHSLQNSFCFDSYWAYRLTRSLPQLVCVPSSSPLAVGPSKPHQLPRQPKLRQHPPTPPPLLRISCTPLIVIRRYHERLHRCRRRGHPLCQRECCH
ncbi:uncharacterized protein EI97DRAFT_252078 [Westerdykella ornata]|uniref:Uncharacterized protein n=1 Tax=Westerdykella ornata TaxID=318751 RepID=A0A6A6JQK3_WESOR|nr:uncharacterized protein EI97DRAFT_252078 [Westerdykella ornata]KAF2278393.1 hypothetical protein EI97DRAFT_252078 [Westerdykella ornata]